MGRVTAVFDNQAQAEKAVNELRRVGVTDTQLSFVSRQGDTPDTAERAGKGALAGAGVGVLFGLAAALIPGVGPFITAGVLASALGTAAGSAAAGAIVGGTTGAFAGALANAGYSREEADHYGTAVEQGNVLVAVDPDGSIAEDRVRTILAQYEGRAYGV